MSESTEVKPLTPEETANLLVKDDPKPEPTEPESPPATPEPEAKAEPAAEPAAEPEKPATPGTPDKALQKLQQDNAAALRRIEQLESKIDEGKPLTDTEQRQLDTARSKLGEVRAKLANFDPLDDGKLAVEAVIETGDQVAKLSAEVAELRNAMRSQQEASAWAVYETKYPGANVRDLFTKAVQEAAETLGEDATPRAVQRLATRWLEERAAAVVESKKATGAGKPATPAKPETKKPVVPVPSQAGQPATTARSADDEYRNLALSLVKD